jgi:hypothetical protein
MSALLCWPAAGYPTCSSLDWLARNARQPEVTYQKYSTYQGAVDEAKCVRDLAIDGRARLLWSRIEMVSAHTRRYRGLW